MIETFRYWGFTREQWQRTVVDQHAIIPVRPSLNPRAVFGRMTIARDFLHLTGPLQSQCEQGWWSWVVLCDQPSSRANVVAKLTEKDGAEHVLLSRPTSDVMQFHCDVDTTIADIEQEKYHRHDPPGYLRFGITPEHLPARMRMAALRTLATIRRFRRPLENVFPSSPLDPSVAVWRHIVRSIVGPDGTEQCQPMWPGSKKYCVVFTHDIDTPYCLRNHRVLGRFRRIEESAGARSAWMIVASLLKEHAGPIDELCSEGHEIGFHDLVHDHRIAFLPLKKMSRRLGSVEQLRERYRTVGFRSPNYLHTPALFEGLSGLVEYDMSMHACLSLLSGTRRTHVGCATAMPFFVGNSNVLEIPNTVPEDVSLEMEGLTPAQAVEHQWRIIQGIKQRGEVANIITHPEPMLSAREPWLRAYAELVSRLAADDDAWITRPCDLNQYWRSRTADISKQFVSETERDFQDSPPELHSCSVNS